MCLWKCCRFFVEKDNITDKELVLQYARKYNINAIGFGSGIKKRNVFDVDKKGNIIFFKYNIYRKITRKEE